MNEFKFNLGDIVQDRISGFEGVVVCTSRWITNCNTYGVKSQKLKDGLPTDNQFFDEPNLVLVKKDVFKEKRDSGGPEQKVKTPNRG